MGDSVFQDLKSVFSQKHADIKNKLVETHKSALSALTTYPANLAAGSLGAMILLTNSLPSLPPKILPAVEQHAFAPSSSEFLISDLHSALPSDVRELTPEEEKQISGILSRDFNMPISAELQGIRLNRSYGLIGAEQHLALYPGDSVGGGHFNTDEEFNTFSDSGMAPGLGAWGYFAKSKFDLTQKDKDREKYYIAVQTFLAPGFHDDVKRYIEFFKYRKMLVVNPENGKSMIVDIADAGPGESTGKHLGGSPEVMRYLERVDGAQRGPVLYFFIDDPTDSIPLGPIQPKNQVKI
ncbi:MAG: hypothetical protein ACM3IJ_03060 [Candidatus Levyibacteriota bacterium]